MPHGVPHFFNPSMAITAGLVTAGSGLLKMASGASLTAAQMALREGVTAVNNTTSPTPESPVSEPIHPSDQPYRWSTGAIFGLAMGLVVAIPACYAGSVALFRCLNPGIGRFFGKNQGKEESIPHGCCEVPSGVSAGGGCDTGGADMCAGGCDTGGADMCAGGGAGGGADLCAGGCDGGCAC